MRARIALIAAIAASIVLSLILPIVVATGRAESSRPAQGRARVPARGLARVAVLGARRHASTSGATSATPHSAIVRLLSLRWDGVLASAVPGAGGSSTSVTSSTSSTSSSSPTSSTSSTSSSSTTSSTSATSSSSPTSAGASAAPAAPAAAPAPAPVPTDATSTTTQDWRCIRYYESGDNYAENSGNGYSGAYQFAPGTWDQAVIGAGYPQYANGWAYLAPAGVQNAAALWLYQREGWAPWSTRWVCGL